MRNVVRCALAGFLLLAASASHAQLYWRADIGWSTALDANLRDNNFAADGFICGDPACNTAGELNEIGDSPVLQLGVGWRLPPNARIDLTIGYRGGYELDDSDALPSDYRADITSWALMANAYYDFNLTWGKPYVGAGLGVAVNKIDSLTNSGGVLAPLVFSMPGGSTTDLAWALMAGITFQINPSLALDLGYRYIDLGKIESDAGTVTCSPACGVDPYSGMSGKLRAHELMLGLRF